MNKKQSKQTLKFTRFGLPILIGLVVSQVALIIVYATVVGDPCQYHLPHEKIAPWYIKIFFPIPEANFHLVSSQTLNLERCEAAIEQPR